MRIVCPACSAAYDVPPERLAAGRAVKCARCAVMWSPMPEPGPGPDPEPVPVPAASTPVSLPEVSPPVVLPARYAEPEPGPPTPAAPAEARLQETFQETSQEVLQDTPQTAPAGPASSPSHILFKPEVPQSRLPDALLAGAWTLTAIALAGCTWAAIAYRAPIMGTWPASERAYLALGLSTRQ